MGWFNFFFNKKYIYIFLIIIFAFHILVFIICFSFLGEFRLPLLFFSCLFVYLFLVRGGRRGRGGGVAVWGVEG